MSLGTVTFPNESAAYRTAREALLDAEIALRRQTEAVAMARRALPLGGKVPTDYGFTEGDDAHKVKMSDLFGPHPTLIAYSFMYGPEMKHPCPMCTSLLDAVDGSAPHVSQRASLVIVAKSPIGRIREFARQRGWRNLRLISSDGTTYNHDYHGENASGQQPVLNVFSRTGGEIRHRYATEMNFAPTDPGQDSRHVDGLSPLWWLLDQTPEGRGDFSTKLSYD